MSHVRGKLDWTVGVFAGVKRRDNQLVLELNDGSVRLMNYENWDGTVQQTADKLYSIPKGSPIRIATWGGYEKSKWFCDVDPINNPRPLSFLSHLSGAWIVKDAHGGRFFSKFFVPSVECFLVYKRRRQSHPPGERLMYYRVDLFPLDPFFETFRPGLSSGMATVLDVLPDSWSETSFNDVHDMDQRIAKHWFSMDLLEFVKFLEQEHLENRNAK